MIASDIINSAQRNMLKRVAPGRYKALAKKAEVRDCLVSDDPLQEVVVDVRSMVFMYVRTRYISAGTGVQSKIGRLLRAMDNICDERRRVFRAAIAAAKHSASLVGAGRVTYVFGGGKPCAYKGPLELERQAVARTRLGQFMGAAARLRHSMLDVGLLGECIAALDSYMVSDLEGVCSAYGGREWMFVPASSYVVAGAQDMFESDRLCARLARGKPCAVMSEDVDCMALFGAGFVIKGAYRGFFSYVTLKDTMDAFCSESRRNLVEKCCIMGTDYNRGLMGVGPKRVRDMSTADVHERCIACLEGQGIGQRNFWEFLLIPPPVEQGN